MALLRAVRLVNDHRTGGEKLLDMTNHLDLRITLGACCFQRQKATCISLQRSLRVRANFSLLRCKHGAIYKELCSISYPQATKIYVLYGRMLHLRGVSAAITISSAGSCFVWSFSSFPYFSRLLISKWWSNTSHSWTAVTNTLSCEV